MTQSRRLRAVLASTAVLGLGAVATLALWSDSELFFGDFTSAGFVVESAPALDMAFEEHDSSADAAVLSFDLPFEGLVSGEPVETELWFRMATATSGEVQMLAPVVERAELNDYVDIEVTTGACSVGGQVLQSGSLGDVAPSPQTLLLPPGDGVGPGIAQALCVGATLRDTSDLPAGHYSTGRVEWSFAVTERVTERVAV